MFLAVFALVSTLSCPQDPAAVRPVTIDARERGIRMIPPQEGPPDRIVALDFQARAPAAGTERLPLARVVRDVDLAVFPDGSCSILAGGVREDLDIYRFDPSSHLVERYATVGGRRLPSSFGSGLGSRPQLLGEGLSLFAFEKENAIRFRAATPKRVVAERTLPLSCEGFRAHFDPSSYIVSVEFTADQDRVIDRFEFLHPVAPRLVVEGVVGGAVVFDPVAPETSHLHALILHNQGARPLPLAFATEGLFAIEPQDATTAQIAAGAGQELRIRFRGGAAGSHEGLLKITSIVSGASLEVVLRAQVRDATAITPEPKRAAEGSDPRQAVPDLTAPSRPSRPQAPPPRLDPGAPVEFRWRDANNVIVDFQLAPDAPDPESVRILDRRTGQTATVPLDARRHGTAVLRAIAFDPLSIRTGVDGELVPLGVVPPALRLDGGSVVVHAPPECPFLLVQVADQGGTLRLVGRGPRWQGRTSVAGLARIDSGLLGIADATAYYALVVLGPDGGALLSEPIEIGPSTPPSGSDRAK